MDMFSSTFIVQVWKLDASSERLRSVSSFYIHFFLQLFATLCTLESHYKLYILYQLINVFAHNSLLFCFLVVCFYFIFGDETKKLWKLILWNTVQGPFVEFFNPKMRRELEKKDEEIKKTAGLKGSAPGGDDWTYLGGNTRVPVSFF